MTPARGRAPLALLHLLAQLAFALLAARAYLGRENTLERSGHWIATKTTLEKGVMGAFHFMRGGQSVARSRLNLSAWFGYQEVIYKRPLRLREIEFDFQLGQKAYLSALFGKTASGFSGVRLSLSERFPSQFFTASDSGEFLTRQPFALPAMRPRTEHRARLRFLPGEVELALDGQPLARSAASLPAEQIVGFRGGRRMALVDDIVFREETGDALRPVASVHESFAPSDFLRVTLWILAGLMLLNGLVLLVGRRRASSPRNLALGSLLANVVGAAMALLLLGYEALVAARYPGLDRALAAHEEQLKIATAEEVRREVRRRHGGRPAGERVLFLGTSQTWGAGAARKDETFVALLERELRAAGRAVECINGGISAVDSSYLVDVFATEWVKLGARIVVIDLGNNDGDAERLGGNVARLIELAREAGAEPLVVLEPNTSEDPGANQDALRVRHAAMRRAADARHVAVVDMQDYLTRNEDRGFLWWDGVHLTSFGQRLFAERLRPELLAVLESGRPGGS